MFPCVSFTKLMYPPKASASPITKAMDTDHRVTQAQRSTPLLDILRYTRKEELWHTNAKDIAPKPAKMVGRMKVLTSDRSMSGLSLRIKDRAMDDGNPAESEAGQEKRESEKQETSV